MKKLLSLFLCFVGASSFAHYLDGFWQGERIQDSWAPYSHVILEFSGNKLNIIRGTGVHHEKAEQYTYRLEGENKIKYWKEEGFESGATYVPLDDDRILAYIWADRPQLYHRLKSPPSILTGKHATPKIKGVKYTFICGEDKVTGNWLGTPENFLPGFYSMLVQINYFDMKFNPPASNPVCNEAIRARVGVFGLKEDVNDLKSYGGLIYFTEGEPAQLLGNLIAVGKPQLFSGGPYTFSAGYKGVAIHFILELIPGE